MFKCRKYINCCVFVWMCAGPTQRLSRVSISTQMIDQETSTLSPENLSLSVSKPQRQASPLVPGFSPEIIKILLMSSTRLSLCSYQGVCPHTSAHHSSQHHQGARRPLWRFTTCEKDVENWGEGSFCWILTLIPVLPFCTFTFLWLSASFNLCNFIIKSKNEAAIVSFSLARPWFTATVPFKELEYLRNGTGPGYHCLRQLNRK